MGSCWRRRAMAFSYVVRCEAVSSRVGWAIRVVRGICRVCRRGSSASRVAGAWRGGALESSAAATVRASRSVMEVERFLTGFQDQDVSIGIGDCEGGTVLDCGDSFFV